MKIQFASDLHLDLLQKRFPGYRVIEPAPDADLLVIAGDIHVGTSALDAFANWPVPVIYVNGNHEAYRMQYGELVDGLRNAARGNIRYLEQDSCVIGGVRFLGCCLWTDYRLYGNPEDAMADAERYLLDHRKIRMGQRLFSAQDALDLHLAAREWLTNALSSPFDGPTVVVTHHGCHPDSIHPRYADMSLNAAFVNDLPHLLQQATLWIHGHVHDSFDYRVGNTRVVVNPRGYARNLHNAASPMEIEWENPLFDGARVVEV